MPILAFSESEYVYISLSRFVDESLVVFRKLRGFERRRKNIPVGLPDREKN